MYRNLIFLNLLAVHAQSPIAVFKADAHLQSVAVRVTDKRGQGVRGLTASDFTLLEDGHPQKIAFFGTEEEPVSLAILLDCSDSMNEGTKLERVRKLLEPLIRNGRSQDEIVLIPFTDRIGAFQSLTTEQRLMPPLVRLPTSGEGTALYDAVATTLCNLRSSRKLRQAVVVITDGADQHSRLRIDQLVRLAQLSKPEIFMIGFLGKEESGDFRRSGSTLRLVSGHAIDNPLQVFARISKESGAESFFPASEGDLQQVLEHVREIIQAQYTLSYYPDNIQKLRKIQVKVHRSGVTVAAPRAVSAEVVDEGVVRFVAPSCEVSAVEHPYPWEPLVTRAPSGAITYRENFSNAQTGWPNHPGSRYTSRAYEIYHTTTIQTRERSPGAVEGTIAAYGPVWRDFTASITVDEQGGAGEGLVFRLNSRGCYMLLLTNIGKPHCAFKLVKTTWPPASSTNGSVHKEGVILPWTEFGELTGRNPSRVAQMRIKVGCKGQQITIWLDDTQVAQIKDSTCLDGHVGMAAFGFGRAAFRDLVVESVP